MIDILIWCALGLPSLFLYIWSGWNLFRVRLTIGDIFMMIISVALGPISLIVSMIILSINIVELVAEKEIVIWRRK